MPRNPDFEQINLVLTKRQHEVLVRYAESHHGVSAVIRAALAALVPDFPADDVPKRGSYEREQKPTT